MANGLLQNDVRNRNLIHLELLRTIAIFLVLFNHTGEEGFLFFLRAKDSRFYPLYLFISVTDKIAVPLFFMVSGALLLKKQESVREIFIKRVLRIILVLLIVSFIIYYVENCGFKISNINLPEFLSIVYQKPIHDSPEQSIFLGKQLLNTVVKYISSHDI